MENPRTEDGLSNATSEDKAIEASSKSTSQVDSAKSAKSSDLILQTPQRHGNSSTGGFLGVLSFNRRVTATGGLGTPLLSSDSKAETSVFANLMSNFTWQRTVSERQKSHVSGSKPTVSRSLSVPVRNVVIVRSTSFATRENRAPDTDSDEITQDLAHEDQEVPEEEAVCRICYEPCHERNTLKLECSCKGALRLLHEACAIKWFSSRKDKNCDVCKKEILNLPVTVFRVQNPAQRDSAELNQQGLSVTSGWQHFSMVFLISTFCYFFFLEQLLIGELKHQALTVATPFAFVIALLATILAVISAVEGSIWTYAALEFALIATTLHLFYSMLHLPPVYAILLSSILGFGLAMGLYYLYIRYFSCCVRVPENGNLV